MLATRRRFNRAEYYRMVEAGILGKRDRVELIKGDIVEMFPIGRLHIAFVMNLSRLLIVRLDDRARVSVHGAVALADDTDAEPDLAVLRRRSYKDREAFAEDVFAVIEVAEASLAYDRTIKLRLYAEAGIPEYWIVDCTAETVEVHRNPGPDGYRDVARVTGTASLTLQAFPDVALTLAEIFA